MVRCALTFEDSKLVGLHALHEDEVIDMAAFESAEIAMRALGETILAFYAEKHERLK